MSEQQNSIEPLSGTGYSDLAEAGLLAIETAQAFLAFAEGKGFPVPAEYQTLPPLLKDLAGSALEEFCQAIAEVQRLYSPQRVRPLPIAIGKIKASDPYAALLRLHEQLQLGVKSAGKEKLVEDGLLREIFSFGVIAEDLELLRQKIEVHDRLYSCQTETPETTEPSPPETQAASEAGGKPKQRRGRPRLTPEQIRKDAELYEQWQVRDSGVAAKDFAKDHGLSLRGFRNILNRHSQRLKRMKGQ